MRPILFAGLLLMLTACGGTETAAQSPGAAPGQSADQVVAEIGGRKITLKEVDDKWRSVDAGEQARITQQLYDGRRNMIDQLVADILIEEAAKAAKLTTDQYVQEEMKKRVQPVTDTDIQQFFEQNKERTQGRTLDQLRQPIREFLVNQRDQQARAQTVEELKTKRGQAVRVLLEPPRTTVELAAHDPALGPDTAPVTIVEFSDYQ
jgi:hypothetical protein